MFETTSAINKETFHEIKKHLIAPRDKWIYILLAIAGILLAVGSAMITVGLDSSYNRPFMAIFAFGVLMTIVMSMRYFGYGNMVIKTNLNRFKESGHTEVQMTTSFTDDKIIVQNATSGATSEFDYDVVCRCAQTKNFYTFFTKAGQFIMVNRTSLIEAGKKEGFVKFIKGKLPRKCFK